MSKRVVAYFSASGVTAKTAKALAEAAEADLYEIQPQIPYTQADLNWMDKKSRSTVEMKDPDSRPAISGSVPGMDQYDVESYDMAGKKIVLFATSGGSGLGDTARTLQKVCPKAEFKGGKLLNGRQSRESLTSWIESLDI